MKLYGSCENGKLSPLLKQRIVDRLHELDGKNITITIEESKKVSHRVHGYYRGYVLPEFHRVFRERGNQFSLDTTHEILKRKFMMKHEVDVDSGEMLEYMPSSADFTQEDWDWFISSLKAWGAEYFDLQLHEPGEQTQAL